MRKTYLTLGALAVSALALSGCKSTAYEGQRDLVKMQLDKAEEAGASKGELASVRDTVDMAQKAEQRAAVDQKEARDDLEWARNELPQAQSRFNEFQRRKERIDGELMRTEESLSELETEQNDLIDRGLSYDQVNTIVGMRRGLLVKRQSELQAESETIDAQLELARLDRQAAEGYIQAAEHRLNAAQARVALASQLYTLADQQGRRLQAEALRARRGELGEEIFLTPTEESFDATTQPAGYGEQGGSQPAGFRQQEQIQQPPQGQPQRPMGAQQPQQQPVNPNQPQRPVNGQQQRVNPNR